MRERLIKPSCIGCPHNYSHLDAIPQKKFGVMMHCGEHYCTDGKRARRFKRSDPKIHVPQWCPKRKNPCELRIYALKSRHDRWMHNSLNCSLGKHFSVSAYRYALRYEGTIELSPYEFLKQGEQSPYDDLLPVAVELYEVLEIDDGLKPVFFYRDMTDFHLEPYFEAGRARGNVMEEDKEPHVSERKEE